MATYLITPAQVSLFRRLPPDIGDDIFYPYVYGAQEGYLRGHLNDLFDALIAAVDAQPTTPLPARFTALLPYVERYLANIVLADMAADHGFIFDSWDMVRKTAEMSQVTDAQRAIVSRKHTENAEMYLVQMQRFLNDNAGTYPEYYTTNGGNIGTKDIRAFTVLNPNRAIF